MALKSEILKQNHHTNECFNRLRFYDACFRTIELIREIIIPDILCIYEGDTQ